MTTRSLHDTIKDLKPSKPHSIKLSSGDAVRIEPSKPITPTKPLNDQLAEFKKMPTINIQTEQKDAKE